MAITRQGHQILAEPVKLNVVVGGSAVKFRITRDSGIKVTHRGGKAALIRVLKGKGFNV